MILDGQILIDFEGNPVNPDNHPAGAGIYFYRNATTLEQAQLAHRLWRKKQEEWTAQKYSHEMYLAAKAQFEDYLRVLSEIAHSKEQDDPEAGNESVPDSVMADIAGLTEAQIVRSHDIDDFEKLRTLVFREATLNGVLLSDALHALRNGSLKVTDEFIHRVMTSMNSLAEHAKSVRMS